MIIKADKNKDRQARHLRVRKVVDGKKKMNGTSEKPRLCVYRSLSKIYAQIVDDINGKTLVSASNLDKDLAASLKGKSKTEQAKLVGEAVAKKALKLKITDVVFDRGGYLYTGRVQSLADGARAAGLKF